MQDHECTPPLSPRLASSWDVFNEPIDHDRHHWQIAPNCTDPQNQSTPEQLLAILCFVYCGWILALGCRAWCNGGGSSIMRGAKLPRLMLAMSAVTLFILVPSIIIDNLSSRVKGELIPK